MQSCTGVDPTNRAVTFSNPRCNSPGRWESLGPQSIHHRCRTYSTFSALLASPWTSLVFLLPADLCLRHIINETRREPAAAECSRPKTKATRVSAWPLYHAEIARRS